MDTVGKERLGQIEKVALAYYYVKQLVSGTLMYNTGSPACHSVMT